MKAVDEVMIVSGLSEKERKIMRTLAQILKAAPESTKSYILGWVEGVASTFGVPGKAEETQ